MVSVPQAIILGIIQGITEWLPVSSSGHLVIAQEFLNLQVPLLFDILLHVGTLIVVVYVFWEDVKNVALSTFVRKYHPYRPMLWFLIYGSIATAIIGFFFKEIFSSFFNNLFVVGSGLLLTGGILWLTKNHRVSRTLRWYDAVLIGLAQGVAIIPGISRSGSTITLALLRGISRQAAARFSFLLMIPAVVGALILQLFDVGIVGIEWVPAIVGTLVAMIVGYVALKILLIVLEHEKFHYFAYYCGVVGLLLIITTMF